jgi:hypothetical protein
VGSDRNTPTHICIFIKREGGRVYFIDANEIPDQNINGVSERSYPENYPLILSFGVLLLRQS